MKKLTGLLCVGILSGICGCASANDGVAAGNVDRVDDTNVVAPLTGTTEGMAQEKTEETKKTVMQQLLDLLHDSWAINDRTYDDLRQQAEEEAHLVGVDPEGWDFSWNNGFRLNRNDGVFKLKFGGRTQFDFAGIGQSGAVEEAIGGRGFGTEFRRSRLYLSGTVDEQLFFKVQYDFAGGDTEFKDVYVGIQNIPYVGAVRVGQFKEPFSLQRLTRGTDITFMERALPGVFDEARNTGVMFSNTMLEQRMTWAAGAFFRSDDTGDTFSNTSNYDITLRLTGLPVYEDDGRNLLHVEGGYTHQFVSEYDISQRPESHLAEKFVDTGPFDADNIDAFNVGSALVLGPFSLQGEVTAGVIDSDVAADPFFWGTYAEASYFLTGEHRPYDLKKAVFVEVKPTNNFDIQTGDWGAWQLAARYSYLDLSDEDLRGGTLNDITAGINWYLFPNTRVMFNYVYAHLNGVGDANIAQLRFQFTF